MMTPVPQSGDPPKSCDPLAAGLFGVQPDAVCPKHEPVPTCTASAFADLFATSEGGDACAAPGQGSEPPPRLA